MAAAEFVKYATETAVKEAGLPAFDAEMIALKLRDVPDNYLVAAIATEIAERKAANPALDKPPINEALEVEAIDNGNVTALGKLHKLYGEEFLKERVATRKAAGTEDTKKKAAEIVKRDDDNRNNPFNPAKTYGSEQARQNEIIKYVKFFGTKAAQKAMARYSVDMAGRPLRKQG